MQHSLYLHIPFCTHRCGYCDFNTYAGLEALIPNYVTALCGEMEGLAARAPGRLEAHTIFFGGGTPSLLPASQVERILATVDRAFTLQPGAEITLEANPGTLSKEHLRLLRGLGVNRLSLGVQSAHPAELHLLERSHDYPDVIRSVAWARQAGFDNLNLDLIFGLPEQALETWQHTLELALGLGPEHFSLYALSLEHGTPFGRWAGRGLISTPDPDLAAEMYEWASERLEKAGYTQYEISNWARTAPDGRTLACRHNLQYWRNLPYLGFGAGAHGYAGGVRTANVLSPRSYIDRLRHRKGEASGAVENQSSDGSSPDASPLPFPRTPATQTAQPVDRLAEIAETMMMGLRLLQEGVPARRFAERFGQTLEQVFGPQINRLVGMSLLEWAQSDRSGDTLRLTHKARLVGNQVFVEFV
jgi:oxygen-independent coproporphyrinogen-3 oxidase